MAYNDARYPFPDRTDLIDIEFHHPIHGWIPMTINEEEYPELWAEVNEGPIAAYRDSPVTTEEEGQDG